MAGQFLSALALLFLVPLGIPATAQERPKAFLGASSKPSAPARFEPVLFEKSTLAVDFISKEMQLKPVHALRDENTARRNRIWPMDGEPNIEGMKHNLRTYAEQIGAKGAPPDVRKFVELSYLTEALTEIGKR
jgi:hypothetical protein